MSKEMITETADDAIIITRDSKGRFKKGNKANLVKKPKEKDVNKDIAKYIRSKCERYNVNYYIDELDRLARKKTKWSTNDKLRAPIIRDLLDRAYGKAPNAGAPIQNENVVVIEAPKELEDI